MYIERTYQIRLGNNSPKVNSYNNSVGTIFLSSFFCSNFYLLFSVNEILVLHMLTSCCWASVSVRNMASRTITGFSGSIAYCSFSARKDPRPYTTSTIMEWAVTLEGSFESVLFVPEKKIGNNFWILFPMDE